MPLRGKEDQRGMAGGQKPLSHSGTSSSFFCFTRDKEINDFLKYHQDLGLVSVWVYIRVKRRSQDSGVVLSIAELKHSNKWNFRNIEAVPSLTPLQGDTPNALLLSPAEPVTGWMMVYGGSNTDFQGWVRKGLTESSLFARPLLVKDGSHCVRSLMAQRPPCWRASSKHSDHQSQWAHPSATPPWCQSQEWRSHLYLPPPATVAPGQSLERAKLYPLNPFWILDHSIQTCAWKGGFFPLLSFGMVGYIEIDHWST